MIFINEMTIQELKQKQLETILIFNPMLDDYHTGIRTIDDIRTLCQTDADYIGLGPFRYTTTKANLSPIIGLDGYRRIMQTMQAEGLTMPICAIGGITADDVVPLMQTGVHAIAVSGSIVKAERPAQAMQALIHSM